MDIRSTDVGSLKVGGYVIIDGAACRVASIQTSKTGKHGHAKSRVEAIGLVDDQKRIIVKPSHDRIEVPIVEKKSAQILSVIGDSANVMDLESYETFNLKIPEDLKDKVTEGKQVLYWIVLNERILKQLK